MMLGSVWNLNCLLEKKTKQQHKKTSAISQLTKQVKNFAYQKERKD